MKLTNGFETSWLTEISIGDYVLTNGSLAASVLIDSVARHVPNVLGDVDSLSDESFEDQLLSYPQYTGRTNSAD